MPSSTTKQAKVMSAISHGWHPDKGSVAKIPVKVAEDFHAADKGHKYGKGMHHKKGDKEKVDKALHTARKYAKKAGGGKTKTPFVHSTEGFRPSPNVEDRRDEWTNRFHDSLYFPPEPIAQQVSGYAQQPLVENTPLANELGATTLYSPTGFADGGDVDNTPDPFASEKFMPEAAKDWTQQAAPKDYQIVQGAGNVLAHTADLPRQMLEGSAQDVQHLGEQGYNPQSVAPATEAAMDIMGASFAGAAPQIGRKAATLGMGAGWTTEGAKNIDKINDAVLGASSYPLEAHPAGGVLAKNLKSFYNKDIAQSAYYLGLSPEDINNNLKSYMTQGVIKGFDEHYAKLMPKAKPTAPAMDPAEELANQYYTHAKQNPKAAYQNFMEDYSSGELEDDPKLQKVHELLASKWNPGDEINSHINEFDEQQQYEQEMEKHLHHEQFINEGAAPKPINDPTVPTNILHPQLSPQDLEEKSGKLGLNTTAFHATKKNFSEFKNPEELGNFPEIGVHFGTLRAAIDRATRGSGVDRDVIENNLRNNQNITRDPLSLKPEGMPRGFQFQVIPARIGANNPLYLNDLGSWNPSRMRDALMAHPEFSAEEVNSAMKVKGPEPQSFHDHQLAATQHIQQLRKLIESKGYDSIAYRNNVEDHGSLSYAIWNLNKARSFYAKFDPALAGSRNLGAAIGGLSLVPIGLYADKQRQGNGMAEGGKVKHKQIDENPQEHEFINFSKGGLIDSDIPGRTDKIPMKVPPGSYVLPADIPSALGQGNTKAGSEVLKKMFTSGPYGLAPPKVHGQQFHFPSHFSIQLPHHKAQGGKVEEEPVKKSKTKVHYGEADTASRRCGTCKYAYGPTGQRHCWLVEGMIKPDDVCNLWEGGVERKAEGGATDHVPIITAGGEWIIHPDVVKHVGEGDMKQGHSLLDKFVMHTRKQHIKTLKGLKGPK